MLRYFGKRILVFFPTLLAISLVAFALSRMTPGDPVECGMSGLSDSNLGGYDRAYAQKIYREEAHRKGLDRPLFYCSFTAAAYPDTLYKILDRFERKTFRKLIDQYGNWPQIDSYRQSLDRFTQSVLALPRNQAQDAQINLRRNLEQLQLSYSDPVISTLFDQMQATVAADSFLQENLQPSLLRLSADYQKIKSEATPNLLYYPRFYWHGTNNQYHFWLSHFLQGDFGTSCRNGQPVLARIKPALWWTLALNIPALLLAFLIAVPIGVYSAVHRDSVFDRLSTIGLFILYSLPSFWIATLLIVFFTTSEYSSIIDFFPSVGLGDLPSSAPFWDRFWERASHLILPIFCMTYASLAFISRQMRSSVLNVIRQDYIRTAKAKGLPENKVVWKHVFRNALFPLITMIALVLPAAIAGSVVIEVIFNIPGMGRETIEAIRARDWPVVYTVLMMAALLTLLGNLLADFLYAQADPRVSFRKA